MAEMEYKNCTSLVPRSKVTWGTSPEDVVAITGTVPDPKEELAPCTHSLFSPKSMQPNVEAKDETKRTLLSVGRWRCSVSSVCFVHGASCFLTFAEAQACRAHARARVCFMIGPCQSCMMQRCHTPPPPHPMV